MENKIYEALSSISASITNSDWKKGLDTTVRKLRDILVFDNLVIYVAENGENPPEVMYARSLGRGRQAEADAAWGENVTNQVLSTGKIVKFNPEEKSQENRVLSPYILGIPLNMLEARGVLILIRFGGPPFLDEQIQLSEIFSGYVTHIIERHLYKESLIQLESVKYQTQLQDDFIATISHEFNTPLGFIKGYSTSLLRSDTSWDAKTVQEFLTIIDEETDQLIALIAQLLDSARLKNGKLPMEFQPMRLDSLIRDLIIRLCTRKKELKIELESEAIPPILGDSNRISQVFENLVENAIKYAPGSPVTINIRNRGDHLEVEVSDQGPGIPEEHFPYLFERFYRVPNQFEKRGTGLGLFICKEIINAHAGKISVRNSTDKGAIFHIEFPIPKANILLSEEKGGNL